MVEFRHIVSAHAHVRAHMYIGAYGYYGRIYMCLSVFTGCIQAYTRVYTHVCSTVPLYTPVSTCICMPVSVSIHEYSGIEVSIYVSTVAYRPVSIMI